MKGSKGEQNQQSILQKVLVVKVCQSQQNKLVQDTLKRSRQTMSDDDPRAYEPAPGDKGKKTKPSQYTKKYKQMYGERRNGVR